MDAQLKSKWVEALRSGEYKQCAGFLENTELKEHCCLGVLCVVAGKEPDHLAYAWLKQATGDYGPFVMMNDDDGKSFAEIADYIEANL